MTSQRGRTQQACHVASAAGISGSGNGRGNKGTELTVKGVAPEGVQSTVYPKTGLDSNKEKTKTYINCINISGFLSPPHILSKSR